MRRPVDIARPGPAGYFLRAARRTDDRRGAGRALALGFLLDRGFGLALDFGTGFGFGFGFGFRFGARRMCAGRSPT
jgi:hypothetical protein